jgi:cell division protease FtsH
MRHATRIHLGYLLLALLSVWIIQDVIEAYRDVATIPYSEFQSLLEHGRIKKISIAADEITGELKQPEDGKRYFVTTRVETELAAELKRHGVEFAGRIESQFLPALISWFAPVLVFFGIWALFIRRFADRLGGGGGFLAIGKSKAKIYVETDTRVTFRDVAGVDEAKAELEETVAFLKDPKSYGRLGARMPKGVLLVGPPGTGKTLLARAVAGEAGVPFFSISGSEFVEMFVGVGAARVRDLFEQARQKAPCIIFIDELDALGRARGVAGPGGHDEKEQTLNQLLVELDGFDPAGGIVLLAATNRPEILDPALLRAGRFDRQILVDRPDKKGREQILAVHVRRVRLGEDVDLDQIAALTPGFTGADLANLVNEAALVATRRGDTQIHKSDFTAAIERIVAGLERKNRLINPREREIVAHHEMGHALVAAALPGTDPVHKVSIIPRGIGALGYTIQRPTDDRYLMTREELEAKMAVLLGGRAAEQIVFGHLSTGAADDLSRVTEIARSMVTRYAMIPHLGNVTYESEPARFLGPAGAIGEQRRYSEETAREIDCAVRDLVEQAFQTARDLLQEHRGVLEEAAGVLLAKETLSDEDLAPFFERVRSGAALAAAGA